MLTHKTPNHPTIERLLYSHNLFSYDIGFIPQQVVAIHTEKPHTAQSGNHEVSARRTKSRWIHTALKRAASVSVSINSSHPARYRLSDDLTEMLLIAGEIKGSGRQTVLDV